MGLRIETFTNAAQASGWRPGNNAGGHTLFKALGHPLTADAIGGLLQRLTASEAIALYDPDAIAADLAAFYDLASLPIDNIYVQRIEDLDRKILGRKPRPITAIGEDRARCLFIAAFDTGPLKAQIEPLLPSGMAVASLDEVRLPEEMLSNPRRYVDPLNFATNFAFFRDADGLHTRIVGANYWSSYGAERPRLWLRLYDAEGALLAEWTEPLPVAGATYAIDSRAVRERHGLEAFCGSLFIHAIGIKGHDVVKYALDIFDDDYTQLSCTHDANAWPADYYAGMPAPEEDETLTLWVQNSHPVPIPAGAIGFNLVGSQAAVAYDQAIPPFATRGIDVGALLGGARWPDQIEISAGRHFVRPRYEVVRADGGAKARRRIAHANVERTDLKPDPEIPRLGQLMGKGYIMPLPVLPIDRFRTVTLPTPMATDQRELPLRVELIDGSGETVAQSYLGRLARHDSVATDIDDWLADAKARLPAGFGHVEYLYDFREGGEADGWLHALGRYEMRESGYRAETIFGAHIYNTALVFRDEPQSYAAAPPGLTTRLFLRLGDDHAGDLETICHLIYPASLPWRAASRTELTLVDGKARPVATEGIEIPCGGSLFWRLGEVFDRSARDKAGPGAYVLIRDTTCRLFGFHGLVRGEASFSLDHMFGF